MATTISVTRISDDGRAAVLEVNGERHYVQMDVLAAAAGEGNAADLRAIYAPVYAQAKEMADRQRDERSWYALVTFGSPSWSGTDDRFLDGGLAGQGLSARARLRHLADEAKGTGSCQGARVVRCADETAARRADISTASDVVYSA